MNFDILFNNKNFDICLEAIKEKYHNMENELEQMREKIRNYNKDEEIAKREATIKDIREHSLLIMSPKEKELERAFRNKHYKLHNDGKFKAIANTYQYELTGTGIGTVIKITCPICGESEDITDFEHW